MPKFLKTIARPGVYYATDPVTKGRKKVAITPERIKRWVDNFEAMKTKGHRIPMPWKHDFKATPESVPDGEKDEATGSKNNAGFWEDLFIDKDGWLVGTVNVPRAEDANRVGTSVQEVSPLVVQNWVSGDGSKYDDALLHIAAVTHPITPGQENFRPVSDKPTYSVALSHFINDDLKGFQMANEEEPTGVSAALAYLQSLGVDLPEDTNEENFVERICVAAKAASSMKKKVEEEDDQEDKEKNMSQPQTQPNPVAMSAEIESLKKSNAAYLSLANEQAKGGVQARIDRLVKAGRIAPAYVKSTLEPMMAAFSLDLGDDGKPKKSTVELLLDGIEAVPANRGGFFHDASEFADATEEGNPMEGEQFSEEDADKLAEQQLQLSGRVRPKS